LQWTEDNKDKLVKYVSKKLSTAGRVIDFFMPMTEEQKSEGWVVLCHSYGVTV
jgi:translation initiation factor 3 subunit B